MELLKQNKQTLLILVIFLEKHRIPKTFQNKTLKQEILNIKKLIHRLISKRIKS